MGQPTSRCAFDRDYWCILEDLQLHRRHKKMSTEKVETADTGYWEEPHLGRGHYVFPAEKYVASVDRCCWRQTPPML